MDKVILQSWTDGLAHILMMYENEIPSYIYQSLGWLYDEIRNELTIEKYKEERKQLCSNLTQTFYSKENLLKQ